MTTFDERLKDIKDFFLGDNEVAGALYDTSEIGELHPEVKEDIKWLIEQAERVQELEEEINDLRDEAIKWNKRFEESEESHLEVLDLLESILKQNKHYREALKEIARGRFSGASYKARKALEEEI